MADVGSEHRFSFTYDLDANALYIYLSDTDPALQAWIEHTIEIEAARTLVDIDPDGKLRGVEILDPGAGRWPVREIITRYDLGFAEADWLMQLANRAQLFSFPVR